MNARTTEKNNAGHTPLYMTKGIDVLRALLAAGADPKAVTEHGRPTWEQHAPAVTKLLKEAAAAG